MTSESFHQNRFLLHSCLVDFKILRKENFTLHNELAIETCVMRKLTLLNTTTEIITQRHKAKESREQFHNQIYNINSNTVSQNMTFFVKDKCY